jgi:hypothetical protein
MNTTAFDTLARQASATRNRRASLKVLGGAAVVAALAAPRAASAGKAGKKAKKLCKKQVSACKKEFEKACEGAEVCLSLGDCCDFLKNCDSARQVKCMTDIL